MTLPGDHPLASTTGRPPASWCRAAPARRPSGTRLLGPAVHASSRGGNVTNCAQPVCLALPMKPQQRAQLASDPSSAYPRRRMNELPVASDGNPDFNERATPRADHRPCQAAISGTPGRIPEGIEFSLAPRCSTRALVRTRMVEVFRGRSRHWRVIRVEMAANPCGSAVVMRRRSRSHNVSNRRP